MKVIHLQLFSTQLRVFLWLLSDEDEEPRFVQLTNQHKGAIRAIRKVRNRCFCLTFLVCSCFPLQKVSKYTPLKTPCTAQCLASWQCSIEGANGFACVHNHWFHQQRHVTLSSLQINDTRTVFFYSDKILCSEAEIQRSTEALWRKRRHWAVLCRSHRPPSQSQKRPNEVERVVLFHVKLHVLVMPLPSRGAWKSRLSGYPSRSGWIKT